MMFHSPYIGMPYYNRYSRYGYRYPYYAYTQKNIIHTNKNKPESEINASRYKNSNYAKNASTLTSKSNTSNTKDNNTTTDKTNTSTNSESRLDSNTDSPLFQLFGLNLYFDDILLIFLIWFLYDEGVKDEGLFISLILLLLS